MKSVTPKHALGGQAALILFAVVIVIDGIAFGCFVVTMSIVIKRKQPFFTGTE